MNRMAKWVACFVVILEQWEDIGIKNFGQPYTTFDVMDIYVFTFANRVKEFCVEWLDLNATHDKKAKQRFAKRFRFRDWKELTTGCVVGKRRSDWRIKMPAAEMTRLSNRQRHRRTLQHARIGRIVFEAIGNPNRRGLELRSSSSREAENKTYAFLAAGRSSRLKSTCLHKYAQRHRHARIWVQPWQQSRRKQ